RRRGLPEWVEDIPHRLGESKEIADSDQADVVVQDLVPLAHEELPEQPHQRVHLARRARPVLLAEGVQRERREPEPPATAHAPPDRSAARLVPRLARLSPRFRPPAVAIHDDPNVVREIPGFDEVHRRGEFPLLTTDCRLSSLPP